MFPRETIFKNLHNGLDDTSFLNLPGRKKGKVRDTYDLGDSLLLITKNRQSAFDRVLASIPYKDAVLPQAPDDLVIELAARYIRLFEMITGSDFRVEESTPIKERMRENLRKAGLL
ncbi:MAG: hypothetical protein JXA18_00190 [Chitinispirillaceae bacterium]|nr:hypothetical protein [Chitinispirillaceae bacterium]